MVCATYGEERISDVIEQDTCNYVMYIQTPLLCTLPLFSKVHHGKKETISCSPVVSDEDYQAYVKKQG